MKKYSSGRFVDAAVRVYGSEADTISSFPATIYADGENASALIYGNMQQSGTPTPSSPIQPQKCGERTAQLWDGTVKNWAINTTNGTIVGTDNRYAIYIPIKENTTYTITRTVGASTYFYYGFTDTKPDSGVVCTAFTSIGATATQGTITNTNNKYLIFFFGGGMSTNIMLNEGSTTLPYEPYGYKIPISSAGQTNNIYLGEVPTTRKIKNLVFDGTEYWKKSGAYAGSFYLEGGAADAINSGYEAFCSHVLFTTISNYAQNKFCFNGSPINLNIWFSQFGASTTVDDFKTYLAQQYANGTPVTIWYVLAEPTTGIVNEPLRKISDYADSVAAAAIPTTAGSQSFSIDTTLKPSSVSLTYTGWHTHVDKKAPWT